MRKKIFSIILILAFTLSFLSFNVFADEKTNTSIKKVVSIVYDDSGSMDNANEDWAYASYSLQNLIGLMNSNDELSVVKMSEYSQTVNFNLTENEERKGDIKSVENWMAKGNTPFSAVETAVSWLKSKKSFYADSQNVEYWLIVITDGSFGSGYPTNMKSYLDSIKNSMGNSKFEGVFVAIGNDVPSNVKNDWISVTGNHLITASNSSDIVNAMSEVSGLILGQGGKSANIVPTIGSDGKSITFETSLPLKKFIIYEQNQSVGIESILAEEERGSVVSDFSTNKPGKGSVKSRIIHCEAIENDYIPMGKITVNFDSKIDVDSSKFKILAVPAVNVSLRVLDKMGNIITDLDTVSFEEGELVEFAAVVTSSIDNSVIDLRNWDESLLAELIVNNKNIQMEYNKQDNMFYGTYKVSEGSNLTYAIVTLPGYFRAKSDVINIYPREIIDSVSSKVSGNTIEVPYKYTSQYEEIAVFEYVVTGNKINGICDFEFKNMPKGITVSVNGIYADEDGKLSLKIYNDIPAEVIFYRNKDYKEIESSKVKIEVTSKQYQLQWIEDSITEIVLNPVKRNISIEEVKLEDADLLKLNNFDDKDIYIFSVLGDGEYLTKEELETLKIENSKIKGISLENEVIEYNGRYALRISCKKELPELFIKVGDITSSVSLKTIYSEKSNNIDISFKIKDSFTKYILPLLIFMIIVMLVGYIPGIKKKLYNKKYHIQANGEDEMIRVKFMTRVIPYITEKGIGSDLTIIATSNSNKVSVVNNFFSGELVYVDGELIQEGVSKFDLSLGSKLKVVDGHRETVYMYCNSRSGDILDSQINDISDDMFGIDDDVYTSKNNNYEEDYF